MKYNHTLWTIFTLTGFLLSGATVHGNSPDPSALEAELSKPVTVINKFGSSVTGRLDRINDTHYKLTALAGAGEVIYTFGPDDGAQLHFPGNEYKLLAVDLIDDGKRAEAIPVLRALYTQRSPFLAFLKESEAVFYARLAVAYLEEGNQIDAISIARRLAPYIKTPKVIRRLEDVVLLAHYRLGLPDETRQLAEAWINKAPRYHDSALGWWIMAQLEFEAENFDGAIWKALRPIVFAGPMPTAYRQHCYAVCIASFRALKNEQMAQTLFNEMKSLGLDWPGIPSLMSWRQN